MGEAAQEVAGLRSADGDGRLDLAGDWIGETGIVVARIPEEGVDVAGRGEADAQYQRVLGSIGQLIEIGRVEPILQAQAMRIGRAGERGARAIGKSPPVARNRDSFTVLCW
jgi:hypothetical protein